MKIKRNIWISVVLFLLVGQVASATGAVKKIGILAFSEQPRYLEAIRGFKDRLKEAGLREPQTEFTIENAEANKALAAELVKKFAAAKLDLIFTVGTHATLAILQEIKDVPIVFAQVYDPVEAGIAKGWQSSGNNTTGATTKIPMSKVMDSLKLFIPVKNLAVLYTPGEKNSEEQLGDLQDIQAKYGIKVIPVLLTKPEEVKELLPIVLRTTDVLYITGSNFVNSQIAIIVDMATKARRVTISHLEDLIEKGVLLGVGPNSYQVGRLAGRKALEIFKGAKPSAIPIETPERIEVMINLKTAKAGDFQIPPDFMKTITQRIQ
jgi:putative tryptophan/tyrosine transport system substrate-binding protein